MGWREPEREQDDSSRTHGVLTPVECQTLQTDAFFDYEVQKICSVVASMATAEFCRILAKYPYEGEIEESRKVKINWDEAWPNFDARCFNLPEQEIANYFWWRMLDAKRNSINMISQSNFSHKELQGKSNDEMQEMLWGQRGINWANLPQGQKIGFICVKRKMEKEIPAGPQKGEKILRNIWSVEKAPSSRAELEKVVQDIQFYKEK